MNSRQNPPTDIASLVAPGVRQLKPYLPGKPISELEREHGVSESIKLASNENPLGASPAAVAAIRDGIDGLALYPDGGGFSLKSALSKKHGIPAQAITLGNGSNDVLVLLAEAFLTPGTNAVYSQYCFAVYPIAVEATGAQARVAPALSPGSSQPLGHDLAAMKARVDADTRLVFIANPNNPTGTWLENDELREFISALPDHVLVVVDEAYREYAEPLGIADTTAWLDQFPRLVVTRTFSKAYGLAGIRVGYSLSSCEIAGYMNRIRQPFNVNSLALAGAEAALQDESFIESSVALNSEGIGHLTTGMNGLGLGVIPSAGNFLLVDIGRAAAPVYEALLRRGIIVRPVGNYGLPNHLRITVGTRQQNQKLLAGLAEVLKGG